jgi:hypothetical protein
VQTSHRIDEVAALPPTEVYWGERDVVLPVRHAHEAARRLTGATLRLYPSAGHFPHLDEAEKLASDLVEFFERPAERVSRTIPPKVNASRRGRRITLGLPSVAAARRSLEGALRWGGRASSSV